MSLTLRSHAFETAALNQDDRREMFALMHEQYRCERAPFEADLKDKDWVLLLRSEGRLQGFSTLKLIPLEHNQAVFFSGDTVVRQEMRHTPQLAQAWAATVFEQAARFEKAWWFLICSGFRTYRFLPVFFRSYYPNPHQKTPPETQQLLDRLAHRLYPGRYHRGVIKLANPTPLRQEHLSQGRRRDPHVAFFLARNPGYHQGDELACITEVSPANLTPAGRRML